MQCYPSMSRIKRSTNGEMALTSLGIHASTSSRLPLPGVLAKCARKSERLFNASIRAMMHPRLQPRANRRHTAPNENLQNPCGNGCSKGNSRAKVKNRKLLNFQEKNRARSKVSMLKELKGSKLLRL